MNGRTNTSVYERILLDSSVPLSSGEIAILAEQRGVVFLGKYRSKTRLVYNSLESSKRFYKLDGNQWMAAAPATAAEPE